MPSRVYEQSMRGSAKVSDTVSDRGASRMQCLYKDMATFSVHRVCYALIASMKVVASLDSPLLFSFSILVSEVALDCKSPDREGG